MKSGSFARRKYWSLLTPLLFSSCYSVSVAGQYLCLVSKGKPFNRVEEPSQQEQQLFERVLRIKTFAENQLGLRPSLNYSRYVRLAADRDYLSAVVSAAPELGFDDYQWSYPFVGKLPYRGYFEPSKAKREALRLKSLGYDVFVRPVDAFSTLGYVRDPLFSYMAKYREDRLANLIIHESFHTTLFVPGDIAFNESLANLIGKYGSRLYMRAQYGAEAERLREKEQDGIKQDRRKFRELVLQLKQNLGAIYNDLALGREQKLDAKKQSIEEWQQQFQASEYEQQFQTEGYRHIAKFPINNAYLALFSLYEDPDDFLENIYQQFLSQQDGDEQAALRQFIELCLRLGKKHGRKTRQALREYAAHMPST